MKNADLVGELPNNQGAGLHVPQRTSLNPGTTAVAPTSGETLPPEIGVLVARVDPVRPPVGLDPQAPHYPAWTRPPGTSDPRPDPLPDRPS